MSTVKTNNVQIGQSATATNNFTWYQPASPDGTVRLGNGNAGAVTDAVTVTSAGNVGIGTTGPTYRLDVVAADATGFGYAQRLRGNSGSNAATLQFTNNAATVEQGIVYAGPSEMSIRTFDTRYLSLWTSATERMRIDSAGNVGIGTSSVGSKLVVENSAATHNVLALRQTNTSYNTDVALYNANNTTSTTLISKRTDGSLWLYQSGADNIIAITSGSERMRIGSNGCVAIGGTGTDASLHIQQSYGGYDRLTQISPSGTSKNAFNIMAAKNGSGGDIWWSWGVTTGNEWTFQPGVNSAMNSSTGIYFTSSAGANKPGGGTWGATSDRRIKTNITPITDAASRIMALKPSSFDYRAPEAHAGRVSDRGFIAQEFEQVYPHGVSESLNICDEEKPFFENGEKLKSVGLNNDFFADLVALVQEQQNIIQTLEARLAALEAK